MTRAHQRGAALRRKLGLTGRVDAEAVANVLGYEVRLLPMGVQKEFAVNGTICVAERLETEWRRWVTAHAIGHQVMHPGNHLWIRRKTWLGRRDEREADDFAHALLLDGREAVQAGLTCSWEVADHFGVPDEIVRLQTPLILDWGADQIGSVG